MKDMKRQMFSSYSPIILFSLIFIEMLSMVSLVSSERLEDHRSNDRFTQQKVVIKRQSNTSDQASSDVPTDAPKDMPLPKDLCSDPVVHTIDRMSNGTVRVYRENHYWDLEGFPDKTKLIGPFLINWEGMAPITQMTKIVTIEDGSSTFKIQNDKFWAYNSNGELFQKSESIRVPIGGLTAVFFDRNQSNPLMLGFRSVNVYYYKFVRIKWQIDGEQDGYPQGRNGEKFPSDLNSAFAIPLKTGYEAYLFRGDKYCQRREKLKSGKDCDEWKDNKSLFGCYAKEESPGVPIPAISQNVTNSQNTVLSTTPTSAAHYVHIGSNCLPFILMIIVLNN